MATLKYYLRKQEPVYTRPISVRIPEALREEIEPYLEKNELNWRQVIVAALEQFRDEVVIKARK